MNYDTCKKFAIFSFIGRILVYFGGVIFNIVITPVYNQQFIEGKMSALELTNSLSRASATFNNCGYLLCGVLAVLGFLFMFMEEREMLLLITSACCGINILPNIFGLLGMDISALGIISKCNLNGVIAYIVFIVLSVAYNLYVAAFSLHSFKNGNAFLGIILALFFVWNVAGSFITTIVQSNINTYGQEAMYQGVMIIGLITAFINLAENVFFIINTSKNY